jgi:hypothetical protein
VLGKWKCAQEPQPKNIEELTMLVDDLGGPRFPAVVHFLLPQGVVEMVHKMMEVATVADNSRAAAAEKAGAPLVVAKAPAGVGATEMHEVLMSARTKFDHLPAFFERKAKAEVVKLLVEEVAQDLKAVKGDAVWTQAIKAVNRHVGLEFGAWSKLTKEKASAALD